MTTPLISSGKPEYEDDVPGVAPRVDGAVTLDVLIADARENKRRGLQQLQRAYERQQNVRIRESFYARHIPAAALLIKPDRFLGGALRARKIRIRYDGTDAATVQPEFEATLWKARAMERESAMVLFGQPRKSMIESIYSVIAYLLGVLDATHGKTVPLSQQERASRVAASLESANAALVTLEERMVRFAKQQSLVLYLLGLFAGVIFALVFVGIVDPDFDTFEQLRLLQPHADDITLCVGAGALGATLSVMVRITKGENLTVNHEQGKLVTVLAGFFRPAIGAILGVALYVLISSNIVPLNTPEDEDEATIALFFAGIAFLAGFSERWAQDTIVQNTPRLQPNPGVTDLEADTAEASSGAAAGRQSAPLPLGSRASTRSAAGPAARRRR